MNDRKCTSCGLSGHFRPTCPVLPEIDKSTARVAAERHLILESRLPVVFELRQVTSHNNLQRNVAAIMRARAGWLRARTARMVGL